MKAKEIRELSAEELQGKLTELRDKAFRQRMQKSLGQIENPQALRETKKDIARILTVLTEKRA